MKRALALLLTLALLLCSAACAHDPKINAPVNFYYPPASDYFGENGSYLSPEVREANGHTDDLMYLISLYLQGPVSDTYASAFPASVRLISVEKTAASLNLTLSENISELTGMALTIACVCLAKTCMELTDAQSVTILAENSGFHFTIDETQILLADQSAEMVMQETTV